MKRHLSPKELAEAIGVSESSVKRWADEGRIGAVRTVGGHRRIAVTEAVRYLRQEGFRLIKPQLLGLRELAEAGDLPDAEDALGAVLTEALQAGDADRARGIILSLYLEGRSIAEICDGPMAGAMHVIGGLWKHGPDGIFIEHRATDICMTALGQLRTLLPTPRQSAPVGVGGAPVGDPYTLPSLMVATVLASDGWREMNLGANTPFEVLLTAARRTRAALVWVALSVEQNGERLADELAHLATQLSKIGASMIIGGRGCPRRLSTPGTNIHVAASMAELVAFAKGLRSALISRAAEDVSKPTSNGGDR